MSLPLSKEAIAQIRRLEIQTRKEVEGLFAGLWASKYKGRGLEFEDLREYQIGDSPRLIDWNVTARMGRPYIRQYAQERELSVILMIDASASMQFGSKETTKRRYAAELAAMIALAAMKNRDRVGLMIFTDQMEHYLRPKRGVSHSIRIIRDLLYFQPKGKKTNLKKSLTQFSNIENKSGLNLFFFSDFLYPVERGIFAPLVSRHDFTALNLYTKSEERLPMTSLFELKSLENDNGSLFDLDEEAYAKLFSSLKRDHEKEVQSFGGSFISIRTDSSVKEAVTSILRSSHA